MFKYFTALSKHATAYNDGLGEAAIKRKEMDICKFAAAKLLTCLM
jgi:hypothetical protein